MVCGQSACTDGKRKYCKHENLVLNLHVTLAEEEDLCIDNEVHSEEAHPLFGVFKLARDRHTKASIKPISAEGRFILTASTLNGLKPVASMLAVLFTAPTVAETRCFFSGAQKHCQYLHTEGWPG